MTAMVVFNNIEAVGKNSIAIKMPNLAPVSYTHLDVYKRQMSYAICRIEF